MKQIAVDSSMKKLSTEALTLQIGCAESPLASFLLILSFYGESLGGRGFVTVLPTIVLQAPLDRARGELPSDSRTLISHWEKFRGKSGEIWRSVIANYTVPLVRAAVISSEGVSLVADNITVALGDPALLNCTLPSYSDEAGAVSIIISKTAGSFSPDK